MCNGTRKSETCFSKQTGSALTEYNSEDEAEQGANYANFNYGRDLGPYFCSKCRKWHLAPKDRQTPSVKCDYCRGRDGKAKDLYHTFSDAKKRAEIIKQEKGLVLQVYECEYNSGWHLTKG